MGNIVKFFTNFAGCFERCCVGEAVASPKTGKLFRIGKETDENQRNKKK
jgi:hypothetical protein